MLREAAVGRRVLLTSLRPAVWALAVAGAASWGLLYYSFGVLSGPMADALGATTTEVAGAFSGALVAAAAAAPLVGRAADRVGAGAVMAGGSALGAVGFGLVAGAPSLAALYGAWAVLGVAHAATSYEPAFTAVTAWFPDAEARRRALLVVTSVGGLASPVFVPLVAAVTVAVGLQGAAWAAAAALALVVTPIYVFVAGLRGPAPERAVPVVPPPLLASVLSIQAFASATLATFAVPALMDRGWAPFDAAGLAGLVGAAQVPARLVYAPLCRWVPTRARLTSILAAQAAALLGVCSTSGAALAVSLAAFGAANGMATLERAAVVVEWFGVEGFGARAGGLAAASTLARAGAPITVAALASRTSYGAAFACVAGALWAGAALQAWGEVRR